MQMLGARRPNVILGSFAQSDRRFYPNSGTQCVANVGSFLLKSSTKKLTDFGKADIDETLFQGNNLYSEIRKVVNKTYLNPYEIPKKVIVHGQEFKHEIKHHVSGLLGGGKNELMSGLCTAFTLANQMYFVYNEFAVGLKVEDGIYYIFDPHSRSIRGLPSSNGKACLIKCVNFKDVETRLLKLFSTANERQFDLIACEIQICSTERAYQKNLVLCSLDTVDTYQNVNTVLAENFFPFIRARQQPQTENNFSDNRNMGADNVPRMKSFRKKEIRIPENIPASDCAYLDKNGRIFSMNEKKTNSQDSEPVQSKRKVQESPKDKKNKKRRVSFKGNKDLHTNIKNNRCKVFCGNVDVTTELNLEGSSDTSLPKRNSVPKRNEHNPGHESQEPSVNSGSTAGNQSSSEYIESPISSGRKKGGKEQQKKKSKRTRPRKIFKKSKIYVNPKKCTPDSLCDVCRTILREQKKLLSEVIVAENKLKEGVPMAQIRSLKRKIKEGKEKLMFTDFETKCRNICIQQHCPEYAVIDINETSTNENNEIGTCSQFISDVHDNCRNVNSDCNITFDNEYEQTEVETFSEQNLENPFNLDEKAKVYGLLKESPEYVCCVCYQMFFPKSVSKVTEGKKEMYMQYLKPDFEQEELVVCNTCKHAIQKGNVPKLAWINGMKFPIVPYELDIFNGEERLISLRIPFMQIKALPRGQQLSLFGNIINVPGNIEPGIIALPRYINSHGTVCIRIKRKLQYKSVYKTFNVRPQRVLLALQWLMENSDLYKESRITINKDWIEKTLEELIQEDILNDVQEHIVSDFGVDDHIPLISEIRYHDEEPIVAFQNFSNEHHENNSTPVHIEDVGEDLEADNLPLKTARVYDLHLQEHEILKCVHDLQLTDTHSNLDENQPLTKSSTPDEHNDGDNDSSDDSSECFSEVDIGDFADGLNSLMENENETRFLDVAPGENEIPKHLFYDEYAEELSFPTIYCGQKMKDIYPGNIRLADRFRWELNSIDRRVSRNSEKIFFMYKKYQYKYIKSSLKFAVRAGRSNGPQKAKDVRTEEQREKISKTDDGFQMFESLRNGPQYLNRKRKEIFAMIRQLGLPTWFISLSAADTRWGSLLSTLAKFVDGVNLTEEEASDLDWKEKCRLINSDPVITARFFDNRFQNFLKKVIYSPSNPLGHAVDHFYKIEFQHRGSPHVHMLLFCSDSPKYIAGDSNQNKKIAAYIDKYVSCSQDTDEETKEKIRMQIHKHSRTCRKNNQPICRFNFPIPPFTKTVVLEPTDDESQEDNRNFKRIKAFLDSIENTSECTLQDMLSMLGLTYEKYELAIRSSLSDTRIFLKRKPSECRVNAYMKSLIKFYDANHDIQFCINSYSVVIYIVNYIQKCDRGVSLGLRKVIEECKRDKVSLKEQINKIGKVFVKSSEISIQEAIYMLLGLPMTGFSRERAIVVTRDRKERTRILKNHNILNALDDECEDIFCDDIFESYRKRPLGMEKWCLADYATKINRLPIKFNLSTGVMCSSRNTIVAFDDKFKYSLRRSQKILRYFCPPKNENEEDYYRINLLLFFPWRFENQIIGQNDTYHARFLGLMEEDRQEIIDIAKIYNKENIHHLAALLQDMNEADNDDSDLAPCTQHDDNITAILESENVTNPHFFKPGRNLNTGDENNDFQNCNDGNQTAASIVEYLWPLADVLTGMNSLNEGQRNFVDHTLNEIIINKSKPLRLFCSGAGGCGKSIILKLLYQTVSRYYSLQPNEDPSKPFVKCLAFTGKAAFIIDGDTIHNSIGMKSKTKYSEYRPVSFDRLNSLKCEFQNVKLLLFDEVSLIGTNFLNYINLRLQDIMGTTESFGGLHIIVFGDLYQLPPVMDDWIFNDMKSNLRILGNNVWQEEFELYELHEIMRQKDDKVFAETLNRIRTDSHTEKDIELILTRSTTEENANLSDILHLFATNDAVNDYNRQCYKKINSEKVIVECTDSILGTFTPSGRKKLLKLSKKQKKDIGSLIPSLELAIGLHYEIVYNLDVKDGLTNGTKGQLKHFQFMGGYDKPAIIWVLFEDEKVGRKQRQNFSHYYSEEKDKSWTPIFAITRTFTLKKNGATVYRTQYPLKQCTARTIHKSQGCTVPSVVINVSGPKRKHMMYVALSRVTSLEGLHVIDFDEDFICIDENVEREMRRLRNEKYLNLCLSRFDSSENVLNISFHNVQSLHKHYECIRKDLDTKDVDIMLMCETRLNSNDCSLDYKFENMVMYRFDEPSKEETTRPYHGLAAYVKCTNILSNVFTGRKNKCEWQMLRLRLDGNILYICSFYKAPKATKENAFQSLKDIKEKISDSAKIIILGDFNIDISESKNAFIIENIKKLFNANQIVMKPTTRAQTKIDLCFTNADVSIENHYKIWSHHTSLCVTYKTNGNWRKRKDSHQRIGD